MTHPERSHGDHDRERADAGDRRRVTDRPTPLSHANLRSSETRRPPAHVRELTPDDFVEFLVAVRSVDDEASTQFIRRILERGVSAEAVFLELLDGAATALGDLWERDECDFVEVTVALGRLQVILRELSLKFLADRASPDTVGRVLLSSMPGEHHTLGLFMVAEFFIREGWDVRLGAPLNAGELGSLVRETHFDVVGFSVASTERLSHVKRTIRQLRRDSQNRHLTVLVGGPVFRERPTMAEHVGADGTSADAKGAPVLARSLIAREDTC